MPTRRELLAALAATAAGSLAACGNGGALVPRGAAIAGLALRSRANDRPYTFLYRMMDRYDTGSTLRMLQSFVPTKALDIGKVAFTYDNAVALIALLARGYAQDVARARVLGDALVYAQAHDAVPDGRIRTAYLAHPFVKANGSPNALTGGNLDVGNTAWSGLALARLYALTRVPAYLAAAKRFGAWIVANAADARGAGGYTGGLTGNGSRIRWKSTEHNLDAYALFTMLSALDTASPWTAHAASALAFVDSMWNAAQKHYWTGSLNDGVSPNTIPIPEDVQTWSFLATRRSAYAASIDWALANLAVSRGGFAGLSFSNADRSGVWFEGTAHTAAALIARAGAGDAAKAGTLLRDIVHAEVAAPHSDGYGIDAASKDGLKTGDGDSYYAALHVGATGWYCIADRAANPFVLP